MAAFVQFRLQIVVKVIVAANIDECQGLCQVVAHLIFLDLVSQLIQCILEVGYLSRKRDHFTLHDRSIRILQIIITKACVLKLCMFK